MNKKEILSLIKNGEGHNLEFKESFSSEIYKEICAFANANGGRILLGVTDKNQIKCIEITTRLKSQIHDLVRNFDPKIEVSTEEVDNILIIKVPEGKNKPYSVNGRFYLRQGTNSQQLSRDEIREFFQKEGKITFDEKIDAKFDFKNDFNELAFEKINYILNETGADTLHFKKEELSRLQKDAYRSFIIYRGLTYLLNPVTLIRKINSFEDFRYVCKLLIKGLGIFLRTFNPLYRKSSDYLYVKSKVKIEVMNE